MPLRRRAATHDLAVGLLGAAICAVFTAGTAVAVGTSAVTITNPSTGKQAHVTGQSSLVVSQRDPATGTYSKIDPTGRQYVSTLPGKPWSSSTLAFSSSDGYGVLGRFEGTEKLAVSSLTLVGMAGSGVIRGDLVVFIGSNSNANCENLGGATFTRYEEYSFAVSTSGMEHLTFPMPLVLSRGTAAGKVTCVSISVVSAPTGWGLEASAAGFRV